MKSRNRKRILFILHMPPPVHGSSVVGKYIMDSTLINELFDCRFVNLATSKSVIEIGKMRLNKLFKYGHILWKALWSLALWKPNLCYITITSKGPAFYKDTLLVILSKLFGIKLLYHFHNKGVSARQDKFLDNLLYQFVFRNTNVILLSKYLYADIQKYVKEEQVYYCPNGIPVIPDMNFELLSSNRKAKAVPEILFLSNMMKEKGVYTLLEACKILHNTGVTFIIHFIGSWIDINKNDFNTFVLFNNLQENVFYGGAKYDDEKFRCFESADIFVFPTYYNNEAFSLVILEAMQCGLPVISTREGGIPDIVDDGITGYFVNKNDPKDLADKIEFLIYNPFLRKKMGAAGKKKLQNKFTISIWENNMFNILKEVANK